MYNRISIQGKAIFGASMFWLHKPMDVVKGVVINDLLSLFLGVTKLP